MIIHVHSDASYLSEKEPKSRAGGFFYMGSSTNTDKKLTKHMMSSAAEAEIGAVFINVKEGAVLRTTLEELGHPQPPRTNGDIKYHRHRLQQWHNLKKTHKSNGYAFLSDKRQSKTRTI
jgi:hypothetical protein